MALDSLGSTAAVGVEKADAGTAEAAGTCQWIFCEMGGRYAVSAICQAVFAATIWDTELV